MTIILILTKKWKRWRNTMAINNELDPQLLKTMFNAIRSAEIKNIKTQMQDDKGMVKKIEEFIYNKVREELKKK